MRQKTIKLNNGLDIPQIGVGTWTLRGDTARQNVCMALKAGFRHIDTAQGSMSVTYPCMLVKLAEHHLIILVNHFPAKVTAVNVCLLRLNRIRHQAKQNCYKKAVSFHFYKGSECYYLLS